MGEKNHPLCYLKPSIVYHVTSYYLVANVADLCWVGWAVMGSRGTQTDHRSGDLLILKHLATALGCNPISFEISSYHLHLVEMTPVFLFKSIWNNSEVSGQVARIDCPWTSQRYVINTAHHLFKQCIKWIQAFVSFAKEYMCHVIIYLGYMVYRKLNLTLSKTNIYVINSCI